MFGEQLVQGRIHIDTTLEELIQKAKKELKKEELIKERILYLPLTGVKFELENTVS